MQRGAEVKTQPEMEVVDATNPDGFVGVRYDSYLSEI